MVFQDISDRQNSSELQQSRFKMAPIADRVLAFAIDFLIFSPVITLFLAGFSKQLKMRLVLEAGSAELFLLFGFLTVSCFVLVVALQALFLFYWQATPGQKILQIRVLNFDSPEQSLTLGQALVRSFFWALSFVFFAVPLLQILGDHWRRSFHEKASETITVTLKNEGALHPIFLEQKFIKSWVGIFFLMIGSTLFLFSVRLWGDLQSGALFSRVYEVQLCSQVSGSTASLQRMDGALVNYLNKEISGACLEQEADFVLWNVRDPQQQGLAYWAKALLETDKSYQGKYAKVLCESQEYQEACAAKRVYEDIENPDAQDLINQISTTAVKKYLQIQNSLATRDLMSAAQYAQELKTYAGSEEVAKHLLIKVAFMLIDEKDKDDGGRAPASLEQNKFIERFKKDYDIP